MSEVTSGVWRRCSACKQPIGLGTDYWVCNVSTCNRKRTALAFCSLTCWEVHLPGANHRDAWAVEKTAPTTAAPPAPSPAPKAGHAAAPRPQSTRLVRPDPPGVVDSSLRESDAPEEVLIVASRLKDYIRARSGFSTSERVLVPLSKIVRRVCDEAIANAARAERKTVLDRDVPG